VRRLARQKAFRDRTHDVLRRLDRRPVDRNDQVAAGAEGNPREFLLEAAGLNARIGGRASCDDGLHRRSRVDGVVEVVGEPRGQGLRRDAEPRVAHLAVLDQLLHRAPRGVDRHGEADSLCSPGVAVDLCVDPDDAAAGVEHRAAGVAAVDRRVRLDRVDEVVARGQRGDRALGRRHDPDAQRALVAERASDRCDGLADGDVRGVPERNHRQGVVGRVDLEEPDVVVDVPADDARAHPVAFPELDENCVCRLRGRRRVALAGRRDHVRVREDVTVRGDHEAGALGGIGRGDGVVRAEKGENRDDAGGALPVDRFGIEVVPRKRLGLGVLVDRVRGRRGAPRRGQGDRPRRTVATDPTRRLGDDESRGRAQKGADHRNDG
jgi:hypothetical protein